MKPENPNEEHADTPLSTAALANVDDRREPQNHASERIVDPLGARDPNTAMQERDRTIVDGGPTLISPRDPKTTDIGQSGNRIEGAANRQPGATGKLTAEEQATPLFSEQESRDLYAKWDALQVGFIDEPRRAVEQADNLVASAMKRTAEVFAEERARLEGQWDRGDSVSTEDLRIAMRRYRSFFKRLLAI